jgi:hypothetical protein
MRSETRYMNGGTFSTSGRPTKGFVPMANLNYFRPWPIAKSLWIKPLDLGKREVYERECFSVLAGW